MKDTSVSFKGTPKEMRSWILRLITKYGEEATLIDVLLREYGVPEVSLR